MMPSECCLQKVEDLRPLDSRPVNLRWLKLIILKIHKYDIIPVILSRFIFSAHRKTNRNQNESTHQSNQHLSYQPTTQVTKWNYIHISYHIIFLSMNQHESTCTSSSIQLVATVLPLEMPPRQRCRAAEATIGGSEVIRARSKAPPGDAKKRRFQGDEWGFFHN